MLAGCDAGNVVTAAQAGAQWGLQLLVVLLGLIPLLYMVQELTVRLGIYLPLGNRQFGYLAAALIGATFNPWMVFYQQAAVADKKLTPRDYAAARAETAVGAVLRSS